MLRKEDVDVYRTSLSIILENMINCDADDTWLYPHKVVPPSSFEAAAKGDSFLFPRCLCITAKMYLRKLRSVALRPT